MKTASIFLDWVRLMFKRREPRGLSTGDYADGTQRTYEGSKWDDDLVYPEKSTENPSPQEKP